MCRSLIFPYSSFITVWKAGLVGVYTRFEFLDVFFCFGWFVCAGGCDAVKSVRDGQQNLVY